MLRIRHKKTFFIKFTYGDTDTLADNLGKGIDSRRFRHSQFRDAAESILLRHRGTPQFSLLFIDGVSVKFFQPWQAACNLNSKLVTRCIDDRVSH